MKDFFSNIWNVFAMVIVSELIIQNVGSLKFKDLWRKGEQFFTATIFVSLGALLYLRLLWLMNSKDPKATQEAVAVSFLLMALLFARLLYSGKIKLYERAQQSDNA